MSLLTREQLDKIRGGALKYFDASEIDYCAEDIVVFEIADHKIDLPFDVKSIKTEETFMDYLYKLMKEHEIKKDPDLYKKIGLSSDKWSKYKNNNVLPKKDVVIALALAMNLNLGETDELLSRANYAFSKAKMRDCVIRECIEMRFYNIDVINEALMDNDLEPFWGHSA